MPTFDRWRRSARARARWYLGRLDALRSRYARVSYSQEGEDMLLERLTEHEAQGFYVDVGAHHPRRFSNTHLLYRRGWSGINIDATPGSMVAFDRDRPRDINLEVAVSQTTEAVTLNVFNEPALNTASAEVAAQRSDQPEYERIRTVSVKGQTLAEILSQHMSGDSIDVMSIDVEGADYDALRSNDWERFRPRILLVEILGVSVRGALDSPTTRFLEELEYEMYAKFVNTVVFLDDRAAGAPRRND